jgi:hypothetical protein
MSDTVNGHNLLPSSSSEFARQMNHARGEGWRLACERLHDVLPSILWLAESHRDVALRKLRAEMRNPYDEQEDQDRHV